MTARTAVLRAIREALGDGGATPAPMVERAYCRAGRLDERAREELFRARVTEYGAEVFRCSQPELGGLIGDICVELGLTTVVCPPRLPLQWRPGSLAVEDHGLSNATLDTAGAALTGCALAIAETGTIVLDSGPEVGRRALTLMVDVHLCVVPASRIVETVPEAVARLAATPPMPLTMISGPSATSDIEFMRVEGVHGPRRLIAMIVD